MAVRWVLAVLVAVLLTSGTARADGPVAEWAGSGARNTETFTVTSPTWQVRWEGRATDAALLQIMIYKADGSFVGLAANQMTPATIAGNSVQRGSGSYYLTINSAGVDWTIVAEELP